MRFEFNTQDANYLLDILEFLFEDYSCTESTDLYWGERKTKQLILMLFDKINHYHTELTPESAAYLDNILEAMNE